MTLANILANRYLPHMRRHLKPRTVAEYTRLADTLLLPTFGALPIASITLSTVEDWHDKQTAMVQANRALALLSAALGYAVARGFIPANPCTGVRRNPERHREHFYMPADAQAIHAAALAFPDIRGRYVALCLLTGARPSELLDSGRATAAFYSFQTARRGSGRSTCRPPPARS